MDLHWNVLTRNESSERKRDCRDQRLRLTKTATKSLKIFIATRNFEFWLIVQVVFPRDSELQFVLLIEAPRNVEFSLDSITNVAVRSFERRRDQRRQRELEVVFMQAARQLDRRSAGTSEKQALRVQVHVLAFVVHGVRFPSSVVTMADSALLGLCPMALRSSMNNEAHACEERKLETCGEEEN